MRIIKQGLAAFLSLAVLLCSGCNSKELRDSLAEKMGSAPTESASIPDAASKKANLKESASESETDDKIYSIGETADLGGVRYTVSDVYYSSGDGWETPRDGYEFVVVDLYIYNGSSEKVSYNVYDFQIENSRGQLSDNNMITIDSDTSLSSGELLPGGEVEGSVSFEAPIGDRHLILHYYRDSWLEDESDLQFKLNGTPQDIASACMNADGTCELIPLCQYTVDEIVAVLGDSYEGGKTSDLSSETDQAFGNYYLSYGPIDIYYDDLKEPPTVMVVDTISNPEITKNFTIFYTSLESPVISDFESYVPSVQLSEDMLQLDFPAELYSPYVGCILCASGGYGVIYSAYIAHDLDRLSVLID